MTDKTELKRLADAANAVMGDVRVDVTITSECGPNQAEIDAVTAFLQLATPQVVLGLLAEIKRLSSACERAEQIINSESKAAAIAGGRANLLQSERAQLKAENELLRKLAGKNSSELRKASAWICRAVEVGTESATHWAIRLNKNADLIDATIGEGEQQ